MLLQWLRIWLIQNFAIQSIYGNNCQIQNCYQTLEPPQLKELLINTPFVCVHQQVIQLKTLMTKKFFATIMTDLEPATKKLLNLVCCNCKTTSQKTSRVRTVTIKRKTTMRTGACLNNWRTFTFDLWYEFLYIWYCFHALDSVDLIML